MPARFIADNYLFRGYTVLQELSTEALQFMENNMRSRTYQKGQRVFLEGTKPSGVYYLKTGMVKKYKPDANGREYIIQVCVSGELLGYTALLSEQPYNYTVATMEESVIGFIPENYFRAMLTQSPGFLNRVFQSMGHDFNVMINMLAAFAHGNVRERTALVLLILNEKYKSTASFNKSPAINMPRADIANMIGTAIENLVRTLRQFKEEGWIETKGRQIRIKDSKTLWSVANC